MSLVKPAALFLCVALAGCAGKSDPVATPLKEGGAQQGKAEPATQIDKSKTAPAAKESSWWSFGGKDKEKDKAAQAKTAKKAESAKISQAWLDDYEKRLRSAVVGSKFEVERRGDVLVVVAPVDPSFNPDRPHMLLPVTLGPLSRLAKLIAAEPQMAVLVVGHADSRGDAVLNRKLSLERAQAMASIFRMSGLKGDRMLLRGVGSDRPRATNDSVTGRASNRRVEVLVTVRDGLSALVAQSYR